MVQRSLFAITDLLQGTKSIFLYTLYGVWGDDFHKKFQILEKKIHFILFHLLFFMYYCCSINLKRQWEHSGLRPDTSSLVSDINLVCTRGFFSLAYLALVFRVYHYDPQQSSKYAAAWLISWCILWHQLRDQSSYWVSVCPVT